MRAPNCDCDVQKAPLPLYYSRVDVKTQQPVGGEADAGRADRWPAGSLLLVVGSADGNLTITAIS